MKVSQIGLDLIAEFEGFRSKAYQDIVGVWTIGYGTTFYHNGRRVKQGDTITKEDAFIHLENVANSFLETVESYVKAELTQNEIDAIASLIYNVGTGNFIKSTLLKKINAELFDEAGNQFLRWNRAGGKEVAGLTRRREAERELFLSK